MTKFLLRHLGFIWGMAAGLLIGTAVFYAALFNMGVL